MEFFSGTIIEIKNDSITGMHSFSSNDYNFTLFSEEINNMLNHGYKKITLLENDQVKTIINLIESE